MLCVGVDVTWWGGSPRRRDSQRETVVAAVLGRPASLTIETIDLHGAKNPRGGESTQANFDADGELVCAGRRAVIGRVEGAFDRVVVALDAPLEARHREGQPARKKAVRKGVKAGSERRQCEDELQAYKSALPKAERSAWSADLRIQAGSPIPPRIDAVVQRLSGLGYVPFRDTVAPTQLVEVFPSEAICRLGLAGHYGSLSSADVRAYKKAKPRRLRVDEAREVAARPLLGFMPVLRSGGVEEVDLRSWIDSIVDFACTMAGRSDGMVRKSKGFDDPVDSGIAFLTAVCFGVGRFTAWGDGSDGVIVGPGKRS